MLLDVLDFLGLHERSGLLKDGFETGFVVKFRTLEVDKRSDFSRGLLLRGLMRHHFQ
jgi:hypothetical protein